MLVSRLFLGFSSMLFLALACGIQLPYCEEVQAAPQRDPYGEESRLLPIPPAELLAKPKSTPHMVLHICYCLLF